MSEQTFVDAVLAGLASPDDVDDWIERWHATDTGETELHEFLGLLETEMESWLQSGETLEQIITRRNNRA
jgi:hypothetical protein